MLRAGSGLAGAEADYTYGYSSGGWTTTATTLGHFTATFLDGLGRTISVKTGTGSTVLSQVNTGYGPCACSPLGKMNAMSQPFTPPSSSPVTFYSYDALGRTTSILLADGASQTTYAYQGNFTTVTDPAGNWKQYVTDAFGNLVTVIEPDPSQHPVVGPPTPTSYPVTSAPAGTLLTGYTYDQFNHLTQVSMPRNVAGSMKTQTRTFVYTPTTYANVTLPAMWLTSATHPESGATSYTYNADGTLASKTDANGNTESYAYDAYQRLKYISGRQQYFYYDNCQFADGVCIGTPGKLVQTYFASGVGPNLLSSWYDYTYTPAGKVASKSLIVQSYSSVPGALTASYTYDNQGALVSQQYPAGGPGTFTYTLDALERPTQMTDSNHHTWASGATYNAANQPLYDGTATRTYNSLNQMPSIVASGLSMTYNYSAAQNNGQIVSSVDGISGETVTYTYDALKRLSAAGNGTWSAGYTYDGYGNLLGIAGNNGPPSISLTAQLDGNGVPTNRISATGVTYDNNGNLTAGFAGLTFSYDKGNRMTAVGGSASQAYAYDAQNLRVYSRNASGAETIYFYGADGKKLAAYTYTIVPAQGNTWQIQFTQQSANVYFLGKLISAEGNTVQVDRLGSVRSGGPGGLGYQAQYPYGVEYTVTANDREKYATYTRDNVTGLDYAMNRYYASVWGRFLSPDPSAASVDLEDPQSWNRYPYSVKDPANLNDPSGLGEGGANAPGKCVTGVGMWWPIFMCSWLFPPGTGSGPMSDSDQPGRGGGVDFPQCNPANSGVISNNLEFIAANYASAQESSQTYGVPADWILGWAALESSSKSPQGNVYGGIAQANNGDNNFFGMTGSGWIGQTSCAVTVTSSSGTFACFASFLASANAALGSKYGQILATDYAVGDTAQEAFTNVYAAGWDKGTAKSSGFLISSTIKNHVDKMLNCLQSNGYLQEDGYIY